MSKLRPFEPALLGMILAIPVAASAAPPAPPAPDGDTAATLSETTRFLSDQHKTTQGSVTIDGKAIAYRADAGVLVVHLKDPMDADAPPPAGEHATPVPQPPEASMSYFAYFKGDKEDPRRPITFLYNGGPGSSTVWLHMGAFG
ncbi:MAG: peptidase S10, partial [Gammaproteobacteria bacterium]|nr:peptidase S10 [Gammaproteobacteria bacterium]